MAAWPEPGWYYEPGGPQVARWWDGVAWGTYAPPPPPVAPPLVDRFGLPVEQPAADQIPGQQTALMDPATQVWMAPPGGGPATATKSRTWLIVLITIVGLLVLFVPAIDVVRRQHHSGIATPQRNVPPQRSSNAPSPSAPQPSSSLRPGPPVFALVPGPPKGFEGDSPVFTSSGVGAGTTGTFLLHGGRIDGDLGADRPGAAFYLDRVGAQPSTKPVTSIDDQGGGGGWLALALPAGKYRLRVVADPSTKWRFNLSETLTLPLVYDVQEAPTGTTFTAHGTGNRATRGFRIAGASGSHGLIRFDSQFMVDSPTVFLLQPVGPQAAGHHAYSVSAQVGSGGLGTIQLPGPGTYRLVVRSTGVWRVSFTVMG